MSFFWTKMQVLCKEYIMKGEINRQNLFVSFETSEASKGDGILP